MKPYENTLQTVNVLGLFSRIKGLRGEMNMLGRPPDSETREILSNDVRVKTLPGQVRIQHVSPGTARERK